MEQEFDIPEIDEAIIKEYGWILAIFFLAAFPWYKDGPDLEAIEKWIEENRPG